jgi:hypothetical protein
MLAEVMVIGTLHQSVVSSRKGLETIATLGIIVAGGKDGKDGNQKAGPL